MHLSPFYKLRSSEWKEERNLLNNNTGTKSLVTFCHKPYLKWLQDTTNKLQSYYSTMIFFCYDISLFCYFHGCTCFPHILHHFLSVLIMISFLIFNCVLLLLIFVLKYIFQYNTFHYYRALQVIKHLLIWHQFYSSETLSLINQYSYWVNEVIRAQIMTW